MKAFGVGVLGAIVALGLFVWGFAAGVKSDAESNSLQMSYLRNEQEMKRESAQMQCIHWVDKWRTAVVGDTTGNGAPPTFGMYVELCGKPTQGVGGPN